MSSFNKVTLIGNLGKDPEVRYVIENVPVANFSLATSESFKDKNGEWQERTEWHNIVAWRGLAERAEKYLKKGMQVFVEGKLQTRSYDDKDGVKRYITEIYAETLFSTGKRENAGGEAGESAGGFNRSSGPSSNGSAQGAAPRPAPDMNNMQIDDDLPF